MNRNFLCCVLCGIAFAIFSLEAGAQSPNTLPIVTADISALDERYRGQWEVHSGKWSFENDELVGSGDSAMDFKGPFEPPFTLSFRVKVISGMRLRVKVGTVTLANEGARRTFQVSQGHAFQYKLNQEYQITMDVTTDSVVVLIDGVRKLDTNQVVGAVPSIIFRAGDYFSKGEARFGDIIIHQAKIPQSPSLAAASDNFIAVLSEQAPNALEWAVAPLDRKVPLDVRQNLTLLRERLLDEAAKHPVVSADAYKLGQALCNDLIATLDERDKALVRSGYTTAQANANMGEITNQALEARRTAAAPGGRRAFTMWPTYYREKDQREELRKQKENGAALEKQRPILEWADRGAQIRKIVDALYAQFREAARQPLSVK